MARKIDHEKTNKKEKAKGTKASRGKSAATGERGVGDNSKITGPVAQDAYLAFRTLKIEQQESNGEFNSDLKKVYEKAGSDLGLSRQIVADEFNERYRQEKRVAKLAGMDKHERQRSDALRKALGPLAEAALKAEANAKAQAKAAAEADQSEAGA